MNQLLHLPTVEQYKTENINLIEYLEHFDPLCSAQLKRAQLAYKQYKEIQSILTGAIDNEDIEKCEFNTRAKKSKHRRHVKQRMLALKECKCDLCGNPIAEALDGHHIIPVSHGGTHDENNLVVLCRSCHSVVHACIEAGGVADNIRDYYADNVEKLEELVKKGIGDDL